MISPGVFREFVPTHTLPPGDRVELAKSSHVITYQSGQVVFQRGEEANAVVYLVSGEVELVSERGTRRVAAATEEARHPLSGGARYLNTATALRPSQLLFVDRDKMDVMLTWAQTGVVEVQDIGASEPGDWMSTMLCNPVFQRIPAANIAQVIACVDFQKVDEGQVLIAQGDVGDFYYVLTDGACEVLRREGDGPTERIDEIGPGRGFGEEALVSGEPRNATIRVTESGSVVRLSADDFQRLLRDPLLSTTTLDDLPKQLTLVDVRLPEEYARGHLPDAINVPLRSLRGEAESMDKGQPLVVYCDTGRRSASAAFLFSERGFDVRLVREGVSPEQMSDS
ncbi:MAG: cyclic nucleotide-binding domain-containing protein [Xanthomonadales bacterium]|nr:cyclic nucleotide-binding domain-containing protein [Xanthomonadales bacterium]